MIDRFDGLCTGEIEAKQQNPNSVYTNMELEKLSHSMLVMAYRDLRRMRDNDNEAYDTLLHEFRIVVADLMRTQEMLRDINNWLSGENGTALPYHVFQQVTDYFKEPF